jgi:hypothetical protein
LKEHKAAGQPHNARDMMRIITFGDYKTVYLSCCVDVVAKRGGSNKVAKRDDGGIAKERSGLAAQVRAVCP